MNEPPDPRVVRLSERFTAIQSSVAKVYGENAAFSAASAAWCMALQNTLGCAIDRVLAGQDRKEIDQELEMLLQAFNKEICKFLKVPQPKAILLATYFHEVIMDMLNDKG